MKWKGRPQSTNVEDRRPRKTSRGKRAPAMTAQDGPKSWRAKRLDKRQQDDLDKAAAARKAYYADRTKDIEDVLHVGKSRHGPRKINRYKKIFEGK